jgi:hypothetical protein
MRLTKLAYKLFFILSISVLVFSLMPAWAFAGGWWRINNTSGTARSDTIGSDVWSELPENADFNSPHGGYTSSSNLCKTCHAVHGAGEASYRLLKDGSDTETRTKGEGTGTIEAVNGKGSARANECMYCHDGSSGASSKIPYELGYTDPGNVRGEHTLGVTSIPDSDVNDGDETGNFGYNDPATGQGKVLQCWQCHSVHGANTIGATYDSSDAIENWNTKILRLDPAGDNSILAVDATGSVNDLGAMETDNGAAVRTAFCADCHNRNPNWETDQDDTTRPNNQSHAQGPGIDSKLEVYGATTTVAAHPLQRMGCRGCHYATIGDAGEVGNSRFPHQSLGWKLLFDEATMTGSASDDLAGDPNRIIPKMDVVCLSCHAVFEDLDLAEESGGLCFNCHASKYGAPDIKPVTLKASTMGITDITRDHDAEEGIASAFSGGNRHAECTDCHNAAEIYPWDSTPITGMWGVSVNSESWDAPPTLVKVDQVSSEEDLCFKCHATDPVNWNLTLPNSKYYVDGAGGTLPTENKAFAFNTKNSAYHPVRTAGRNQSTALKGQLSSAGLSTTSTIECVDCHNNDETGDEPSERGVAANSDAVSGPHGSDYAPLLRAKYWTNAVSLPSATATAINQAAVEENLALCFLCHEANKLLSNDPNIYSTNFSNDGGQNFHYRHLIAIGAAPEDPEEPQAFGVVPVCRVCHYNMHSNEQADNTEYRYYNGAWDTGYPGNGTKTRLINFAPLVNTASGFPKPRWRLNNISSNQRACFLDCHLKDGDGNPKVETMNGSNSYQPSAGLDDDSMFFTP